MWTKSHSKVIKGLNKEAIWQRWSDVSTWHTWIPNIEYCKMDKPFATGNRYILKPRGSAPVTVELIEVKKDHKFIGRTHFFGATMYDIHEMHQDPQGLRLTVTIKVSGPLGFFWRKLVAEKIGNNLPKLISNLASVAGGPALKSDYTLPQTGFPGAKKPNLHLVTPTSLKSKPKVKGKAKAKAKTKAKAKSSVSANINSKIKVTSSMSQTALKPIPTVAKKSPTKASKKPKLKVTASKKSKPKTKTLASKKPTVKASAAKKTKPKTKAKTKVKTLASKKPTTKASTAKKAKPKTKASAVKKTKPKTKASKKPKTKSSAVKKTTTKKKTAAKKTTAKATKKLNAKG